VSDALACLVCNGHTIFHRDATDRNEWQNISCTQTRMLAAMPAHIDQFRGNRDCPHGGFYNSPGRGDKGYN
jgi:hypothetical protein